MTTLRKILLGAASLAALAAASSASAQSTATATGTASVTIIAPITLTKAVDLVFGKVVPPGGATEGTVVIAAASGSGATPSLGTTLLTGITRSAAKFTVGGTGAQTYAITLPSGATNLGVSGLDVDTWTSSWTSGDTITSAPDLYVGGTLHVPPTVAAGTYTGTFNVSVNYN